MAGSRKVGGPLRRIGRAYRCEVLKASRQPTLAIYAFVVFLVTALAGWQASSSEDAPVAAEQNGVAGEDSGLFEAPAAPASEEEAELPESNAFPVFAAAARAGFAVSAILILLFSATLLSGEATGGTFRLLLTRPVTKTDVLLGKWLILCTSVITFSLIAVLVAWLLGHLAGSYADVQPYTASELAERALICSLVTPLGLLAFAGLGLFLSSLFQGSATAVAWATLAGFSAFAANLFLTEADSLYNLSTYATRYMAMLEGWTGGESGYSFGFRQVRPALLVPPAYAFAFLTGARIIFGRRDIHS